MFEVPNNHIHHGESVQLYVEDKSKDHIDLDLFYFRRFKHYLIT